MKIAVCVKHVPESQSKRLDPATKRLDRSGEGALNAFDANAIEEGLRLKEAAGEGEVVLVSLGPERALDSLRKGLAMGADRAVLVSDAAAEGSDLVATSRALAMALEREQADVILFGQQSSDSDGAVLWAAVAGGGRCVRRDQRAALSVAEGNHGREEEAAGNARRVGVAARRVAAGRGRVGDAGAGAQRPARARGHGQDRGRRRRRSATRCTAC